MFYENDDKNIKTDKILVLKPREGKTPKTAAGSIDKRLFTGDNKLHVIQDEDSCLWYFKYDSGILPGGLQQKFTSSSKALTYAKEYYDKRDVDIAEVID